MFWCEGDITKIMGRSGRTGRSICQEVSRMSIAIDEILIQVPHEIAETYRQAITETRQQMAQQIGVIFDVFNPEISSDLVSFKNLLLDAIERSLSRGDSRCVDECVSR